MFEKILLAADGSDHSLRAADKAIALAKMNNNSVVHVIYVVDGDTAKTDVLHHWNDADMSLARKELLIPVENKMKVSGVHYETNILRGNPGQTIVQHANENQFDLIVIGSRGLNTLQEFVLGSVSHKVAKRADSSVLIVK
jgi:nucleotide-binding universal stress UspA family protein